MSTLNVPAGTTTTITTSETDDVTLGALSTLNITGAPQAKITVVLSSLAGASLLNTINITNANVVVAGAANVSALTAFRIGDGGTLTVQNAAAVAAGTTIEFTGSTGNLVFSNGIAIPLLSQLKGFGPGKTIDVTGAAASSLSYVDAPGTNTGGIIKLLDANSQQVLAITLNNGDFVTSDFHLQADGVGGSLINFNAVATGVSATPQNATLGVGATAVFTVTTNKPVAITGAPTLLLNDGGVATYDAALSQGNQLAFVYTVSAGQTSADLVVTGVASNGAVMTAADGSGFDLSTATGNPIGILAVDTTAPTVLSVVASNPNATLGVGGSVALTVNVSEPVTLNTTAGTPTLTLSDGGTATYDASASTATSLVFRHTVAPGQNATDLAVTSANLNGATIADVAGNLLNLAAATGNPAGILVVDTTAPTVLSVVASNPNATLGVGGSVALTVNVSEPVTLNTTAGAPTLTLSDGGTATYDASASTATSLVFRHTVAPGQNATDLAVTSANLNGATIADVAGNLLNLAAAAGNPAGILVVDTTAPTVLSVVASNPNATLGVGGSVALTVNVSEPVTLNTTAGTPTLTLNDGGTATYDASASTATSLVFRHTVAPGQNATDLAVTSANLNGATIADVAGNLLNLAAAAGNPAGILVVDTTAPVATSISATAPSTVLGAGGVVTITVTPSEAVSVTGGSPQLTLSDGGTAQFDAARSTPTSLVFTHTVATGNNSADLAITGLTLNNALITDAAGNALAPSSVIGNPPGILTIDTLPPVVTGISANPATGTLVAGQTIAITVALNEALASGGGTPQLTLSDGGVATFDAALSSPTQLVFTHTVQPGQSAASLAVTSMSVTGAPLTDLAGNPLDLATLANARVGTLAVDTTNPVVIALTTNPTSGALGAGQTVDVIATLNRAITLTGGVPTLTLSDGGTAAYDPLRSTPTTLVFSHQVQPGQTTADLSVTGVSLNGATVADAAGHTLNLGSLIGNPAGILAIDTTAPSVTSVAMSPASGMLTAGQVVTITLNVSEALAAGSGTPSLTLNDGGTATFDALNSTSSRLVFVHTVQAGQNAADLEVTALNVGNPLTNAAGNPLDVSQALNRVSGIVVDTTAPTVTGITTSPGSGIVGGNQTVAITAALSEPIRLLGGSPVLRLSDGGFATIDASNTSPASLVFRHTVQPGQTAQDLAIIGVIANGAVVTDLAGNALDLNALIGNPAGTLQVDGRAPAVTGVTMNPGSGTLGTGQTVSIAVALDEAVVLDGTSTPTLSLSDGGTAILDIAASSPTLLVFKHAVQAGQNTPDLQVVGVNLAGTPLRDAAGNALDLSAAIVNPAGLLAVSTTPSAGPSPVGGTDPAPISNGGVTVGTDPAPAPSTTSNNSTPSTLDVYRFFDSRNGTHFYTTSNTERASILASRPDLVPEGQDGVGLRAVNPASGDPAAVEVFRFFDTIHGTQFLTASKSERDDLLSTRPDLRFEPQGSFFEHAQPQPNDTAVYRFFSSTDGTHFYTDSAAERLTILQTRPDLIAEGIGFYEPG